MSIITFSFEVISSGEIEIVVNQSLDKVTWYALQAVELSKLVLYAKSKKVVKAISE